MISEFQNRAKILIIDDEVANILLLEKILGREGYRHVTTTTDPRQGITLFKENQPDLVLLDLYMPYVNGFEVMAALADLIPARTFLPIVVLTADASVKTRNNALDNGAIDFILKPFDNLEVSLRIRNALRTRFLYLELNSQNQILFDVLPNRPRTPPGATQNGGPIVATTS